MPNMEPSSAAVGALGRALERYDSSVDSAPQAYAAATEAAMWIIAIDDDRQGHDSRYASRRDGDPQGQVIPLLRVLRNFLIHAMGVPATQPTGAFSAAFSRGFDRVRLVWTVPPEQSGMSKRDRHHLPECRQRLDGQEVHHALRKAHEFYVREGIREP